MLGGCIILAFLAIHVYKVACFQSSPILSRKLTYSSGSVYGSGGRLRKLSEPKISFASRKALFAKANANKCTSIRISSHDKIVAAVVAAALTCAAVTLWPPAALALDVQAQQALQLMNGGYQSRTPDSVVTVVLVTSVIYINWKIYRWLSYN